MHRDAILPSQEPKRRNEVLTEESFNALPSESLNTSTMLGPISSSSSLYTERSLPPIPVISSNISASSHGTPRQGQLTPPPVSPSMYAPSRPVSRTSTISQDRCNSPSIANLGRLSVVKQRLAQIERNSPHPSSSGLTSPMWSPQTSRRTCRTTPLISPRERDQSPDSLKLQRSNSVRSNVVDAIFSSYGDALSISGDANQLEPHVSKFSEQSESMVHPVDRLESLQDHGCCLPTTPGDQVPLRHDLLSKIDQRTEMNGDLIEARTITAEDRQRKCYMSSSSDAASIIQALQSMREQLATDFPAVLNTLAQIQESQAMVRDMREVSLSDTNTTHQKSSVAIDLSGLNAKLDDLLVDCKAVATNHPSNEVR
jgi:hypothetical protein